MLSPEFQERLDKWKQNRLANPSAEKIRQKPLPRGDYGDDMRDYYKKEAESLAREQNFDSNFRRD